MKELRRIRTLILALSIASFGTTLGAVEITGTWVGKEKCDCFNNSDGKFKERFNE